MTNPEFILHFYPTSPFAQKVAWALQYKNVDFKVVMISPLEPRPLRRPLDGGYRKTPVLQIGNHTYCDSKVIFAELEKRFPEPSFYPEGSESLANGLSRWTDTVLFNAVVTQIPWKALGDDFVKDRSAFSGKPINKDAAAFAGPYLLQTVRSEIEAVNSIVKDKSQNGELFALGTKTLSVFDLSISMNLWFLSNFTGKPWLETNFPVLDKIVNKTLAAVRFADLKNLKQISAEDALKVAKEQTWESENSHDGTLDITLGKFVSVTPTDSGAVPALGKLVHSTINETIIEHKEEKYGFTSYTHFPTLSFVVLPQKPKL